jgi:hypothetical protein
MDQVILCFGLGEYYWGLLEEGRVGLLLGSRPKHPRSWRKVEKQRGSMVSLGLEQLVYLYLRTIFNHQMGIGS